MEHIHAHIHTKMTIGMLAGIACMSSSHFSHVCKTETGKTPLAYVKEVRMRRVKKLLIAGDRSITEIAHECGFGSSAYHTPSFYKKYKITPSNFMTANKEKQDF